MRTKTVSYNKVKETEIRAIGVSVGLGGRKLNDYVKFITKRFPKEFSRSYIEEWALRFRDYKEWRLSDLKSRRVLMKINPDRYGKDINAEAKYDFA